jgi:hypothetical protein
MKEQTTPVEMRPDPVNIQEKPEDTPRSIDVIRSEDNTTGRTYANALLAVATATQIFGSSYTATTDWSPNSKDMTRLSMEELTMQRKDFFVPYPVSTVEFSPERESSAEAANRSRLELLARLYVSKHLSPEQDARLAIVTERVRRLIPRVTIDDFEALETIALESEAIRAANVERRRRLGI